MVRAEPQKLDGLEAELRQIHQDFPILSWLFLRRIDKRITAFIERERKR